jgi:hypothetical protein
LHTSLALHMNMGTVHGDCRDLSNTFDFRNTMARILKRASISAGKQINGGNVSR